MPSWTATDKLVRRDERTSGLTAYSASGSSAGRWTVAFRLQTAMARHISRCSAMEELVTGVDGLARVVQKVLLGTLF